MLFSLHCRWYAALAAIHSIQQWIQIWRLDSPQTINSRSKWLTLLFSHQQLSSHTLHESLKQNQTPLLSSHHTLPIFIILPTLQQCSQKFANAWRLSGHLRDANRNKRFKPMCSSVLPCLPKGEINQDPLKDPSRGLW